MGYYESYIAATLIRLLGNFVVAHDLGIVAGADGMMRLAPGWYGFQTCHLCPGRNSQGAACRARPYLT